MDITQLKSFIAVAETQSFSKAAEQLFITQPAVSKRIANLEDLLGAKLFDRIGHQVVLTQAGTVLKSKAQDIVNAMENCVQDIKNLHGDISGSLRVGLSHYIGLERIPTMLNSFSKKYPQVELDILFYDSENAQQDVLNGTIDIAVVTLPSTLGKHQLVADLAETPIWKDPLCFAVHKNHQLSKLKKASIDDLKNFTGLLPNLNTYTGKIVANYFEQNEVALTASHPTNNLENIKVMLATGFMPNCWGVLPKTMTNDKNIRALNIKAPSLLRQLGCLHSKQRSLSNAAQEFINVLKTYAD